MSDHTRLALIFVIILVFLAWYAVAFGSPKPGDIIPIPVPNIVVEGPYKQGPPAQPKRKPDAAGVADTCEDGSEVWLMMWDAPEELGFLYAARNAQAEDSPLAIIHWGPDGIMDIGWYKGRAWTRDELTSRYYKPCDLVKDR